MAIKNPPWYQVVTPRREVREGRSFSPDEFAIALEQVVAGTAPLDYRDPAQFFSRTCMTRALKDHAGKVLRRLAGQTQDTSPVLTLVTQFGGGKTHTLTALWHLAHAGKGAAQLAGVSDLLAHAGIAEPPGAKVGVFVGNAWDPSEGRETPWIDLARQLAGDEGVAALGTAARTTPPGTEAITRVFAAAQAPVLLLFDEVLNFVGRHRSHADSFHAFIQNLTVAVTGIPGAAAVISLPRSQVEMTEWDQAQQDRITKVVRRVAHDLIANDEAEIGDVVRRRLFEDLGDEKIRRRVSRMYADWCFERNHRLPPEWTTVDSASTGVRAREFLRGRFESCYPFHPATLSVFRRKWSALPHFQQTRGALAMLAQWISWAAREHFQQARTEPLITLGSAPLDAPEFRAVVLGQLGEQRLDVAINTDLAAPNARVNALDADSKGGLRNIHRRVGVAILFESSGGQVDKVARLPELRFAIGGPDAETTSVDNAAQALEAVSFFMRKVGADGYRIHHQATLKKVVSDRRAALDEEKEVQPAVRELVKDVFSRSTDLPILSFPEDSAAIQDTPRLILVVLDPETEWDAPDSAIPERIARWTRERGDAQRLYPASLVWCVRKSGQGLRDRVAQSLAWRQVLQEVNEGSLGPELDRMERGELRRHVENAVVAAREEVWGSYRIVATASGKADSGLEVMDMGAGHGSASETLAGRVLSELKTRALLSETVSAGYIDRNWPPALKATGAWPVKGLRQSFLNGSLIRLMNPDRTLREKLAEFVEKGEFGLASGAQPDGGYERWWYAEPVAAEEVAFDPDVYLLTRERSEALRTQSEPEPRPHPADPDPEPDPDDPIRPVVPISAPPVRLRVSGTVPPEMWSRFGIKMVPTLQTGAGFTAAIKLEVEASAASVADMETKLQRTLKDLNLEGRIRVERLREP